jgi:hypothetical protein
MFLLSRSSRVYDLIYIRLRMTFLSLGAFFWIPLSLSGVFVRKRL